MTFQVLRLAHLFCLNLYNGLEVHNTRGMKYEIVDYELYDASNEAQTLQLNSHIIAS